MFFFFFSSRRRHTRCGRDWSSDVCSSDLGNQGRLDVWPWRRRYEIRPFGQPIRLEGSTKYWAPARRQRDRKSTRLNSSHVRISYAVFCLKKKKIIRKTVVAN